MNTIYVVAPWSVAGMMIHAATRAEIAGAEGLHRFAMAIGVMALVLSLRGLL